jgi:hypothetical protein
LQTRIERNDIINHIFIDVWINVDSHKHSLRVMIDSDVIENFVSQFKIKKLSFQDELSLKEELKILNKTSLRTYHAHSLRFEISNFDDHCHKNKNEFIEVDMNEIEMILELSWLRTVNFDINWMFRHNVAEWARARRALAALVQVIKNSR